MKTKAQRNQFLLGLVMVTLLGCKTITEIKTSQKDRPNVILIMPDQWRGFDLGCMGNTDVKTPHIDQLASEGLLLKNTFANSPVCCPARATILTGEYAHKNGMVANDLRLKEEKVTIAELFQNEGYKTGFIGKWHLDGGPRHPGYIPPGPRRQGFQFWAANECNHNHFGGSYFKDGPEPLAIYDFEPVVWTDEAIKFLKNTSSDPFFLMIAPGPPHNPYKAPKKYRDLYNEDEITMRVNWEEGIVNGTRENIAEYYAMMTAVDDQVGRLLKVLKEQGKEENTIVLFTSDHGDMLGSQGKLLKRKPWEESIRVPGIIKYPDKIKAGSKTQELFSHVDMAPTLLSLCGIPTNKEMQGSDLSPVILGKKEKGPKAVYFEILGPYKKQDLPAGWRGLRTKEYMYAKYESKPWVLYDVNEDPYELNNLLGNMQYKGIEEKMSDTLEHWMKHTEDSWGNNWTVPVEDDGRLYDKYDKTFYTVDQYLEFSNGKLLLSTDP